MKEFPVSTSANRTKRSLSSNQFQPISKPYTQHQQTEEEQKDDVLETMWYNISTQEDFYLEHSFSTCTQENSGGSHGRYQLTV